MTSPTKPIRFTRFTAITLGFLAIAAGGALAAEAISTSQPTADDVQFLLEQKKYGDAVRLASRLLTLHGKVAEGLNRYQLLCLKGEGLLGTKAIPLAAASYEQAIKETTDAQEIAVAKCTALLIHRSATGSYIPKTGDGTTKPAPIDLRDLTRRKDAFAALLDDELVALKPTIKSASAAQSVLPIFPVLQKIDDLSALDQVANGDNKKTTELAGGLVEHARVLIASALKGMWAKVDDIDKQASKSNSYSVPMNVNGNMVNQTVTTKAGLTNAQKSDLQDSISTCDKIRSAVNTLSTKSGSDKDWATILNDTDRVATRARDVLNADYSGIQRSDEPATFTQPTYTPTVPPVYRK